MEGTSIEKEDYTCPICLYVMVEPVTMPCQHSLCLPCYKQTVEKANLSCPICRMRISVWARKASKTNTLIDEEKWEIIKTYFSDKVQQRLEGGEGGDNDDESDSEDYTTHLRKLKELSKPGEIRQEYEAAMQKLQHQREEEAKKEEEASAALIRALQEEEEREMEELDREREELERLGRETAEQLQQNVSLESQDNQETQAESANSCRSSANSRTAMKNSSHGGKKGKSKQTNRPTSSSSSLTLNNFFSPVPRSTSATHSGRDENVSEIPHTRDGPATSPYPYSCVSPQGKILYGLSPQTVTPQGRSNSSSSEEEAPCLEEHSYSTASAKTIDLTDPYAETLARPRTDLPSYDITKVKSEPEDIFGPGPSGLGTSHDTHVQAQQYETHSGRQGIQFQPITSCVRTPPKKLSNGCVHDPPLVRARPTNLTTIFIKRQAATGSSSSRLQSGPGPVSTLTSGSQPYLLLSARSSSSSSSSSSPWQRSPSLVTISSSTGPSCAAATPVVDHLNQNTNNYNLHPNHNTQNPHPKHNSKLPSASHSHTFSQSKTSFATQTGVKGQEDKVRDEGLEVSKKESTSVVRLGQAIDRNRVGQEAEAGSSGHSLSTTTHTEGRSVTVNTAAGVKAVNTAAGVKAVNAAARVNQKIPEIGGETSDEAEYFTALSDDDDDDGEFSDGVVARGGLAQKTQVVCDKDRQECDIVEKSGDVEEDDNDDDNSDSDDEKTLVDGDDKEADADGESDKEDVDNDVSELESEASDCCVEILCSSDEENDNNINKNQNGGDRGEMIRRALHKTVEKSRTSRPLKVSGKQNVKTGNRKRKTPPCLTLRDSEDSESGSIKRWCVLDGLDSCRETESKKGFTAQKKMSSQQVKNSHQKGRVGKGKGKNTLDSFVNRKQRISSDDADSLKKATEEYDDDHGLTHDDHGLTHDDHGLTHDDHGLTHNDLTQSLGSEMEECASTSRKRKIYEYEENDLIGLEGQEHVGLTQEERDHLLALQLQEMYAKLDKNNINVDRFKGAKDQYSLRKKRRLK